MLVINELQNQKTPLEANWHGTPVKFEYYSHRFTLERDARLQREAREAQKRAEEARKKAQEAAEKDEDFTEDEDLPDPWTVDFLLELLASWEVALDAGDTEPAAITRENIVRLPGRLLLAMAVAIGGDVNADPPKEPSS